MKRFKNILAIVSFEGDNTTVIDKTIWLAKANDAHLTLLDTISEETGALARLFSTGAQSESEAIDVSDVESEILQARQATIDELADKCRAAGVETRSMIQGGPIFLSTIRKVLADDHDLVLKTASADGDQFFLSDDLHLMRKCPCPVWILSADSGPPVGGAAHTVLAAVDPDPEDVTRDTLAHTVMTLASSLAERTQANLHVVNAWGLAMEPAMRSTRVKMRPSDIDAIIERERLQSAQRLNALVADFPDQTGRRVVAHRKGPAGDVVPAYAAEIGANTLVMGTVGRTGVSGFFIGNSAETILNRVRCSVLTTKPPGFVSPVELGGG